jgi:hypothetical protein
MMAGTVLSAMKNPPFIFKATDLRELIGKLGGENIVFGMRGMGQARGGSGVDTETGGGSRAGRVAGDAGVYETVQ